MVFIVLLIFFYDSSQYFDFYFFKYLSSSLKFCSSLSELFISLSRFQKVKQFKSLNSALKPKKAYIKNYLALSFTLSTVKLLQYGLNHSFLNGYAQEYLLIEIGNAYYQINHNSFLKLAFPYDNLNIVECKTLDSNGMIKITFEICNYFKYFLYSYYIISCFVVIILIICIDMCLLKFVKDRNKSKIKLIGGMDLMKINEIKTKEKTITKIVILNSCFLLVLRSPEVVATIYHMKFNAEPTQLSYFYRVGSLNEIFDFVYTLHPVFQFILFYKYNQYFRDSFVSIFKKEIKS